MAQQLFTHTRTVSFQVDGASVINATSQQSGSEKNDIDASIAASTTNESLSFNLTLANLKSVMIYADGALTLKTNSSGSPQETITLAAGQEITWQTGDPGSAPFAGNVTALFVTNGSSTAAVNLKIRALSNQ
jgi:type IV secretory pathway VirB9-like protein